MNLRRLAARNVWQQRGRYLSYLASAAFSVMIFFIYTALVYHPAIREGEYRGAAYAADGMQAASVVILVFTFLFLLYSASAFMRTRKKELGLLTLLGVTRGQMVQIILWENLLISLASLGFGTGFGLLFVKLFFKAISLLLGLPGELPFYAGPPVWATTYGLFGAMFIVVSLFSLRGVFSNSVIELIRSAREPKAAPRFSKWRAALGILLVGGGYAWAAVPHPAIVGIGILPVTTIVSIGTYFLMKESSIAVLNWLHQRPRFFFRTGPFLSVSQLKFKIQENYRVLSSVAVMVAVILSAMGTIYSFFSLMSKDAEYVTPWAFQAATKGAPAPAAAIEEALATHGVEGVRRFELTTFVTTLGDPGEVTVVPYSFYTVAPRAGEPLPAPAAGTGILVGSWSPSSAVLEVGGSQLPLDLTLDRHGRVTNPAFDDLYLPYQALVLSDDTFAQVLGLVPEAEQIHLVAYDTNWSAAAARRAHGELKETLTQGYSSTAQYYELTVGSMGLVLFIGFFVTLVFFAACLSLLYFRLFTEIDEDRKYYRRLKELGASDGELRKVAIGQAAVIFLVPFILGFVHSTFAMKALGTLLQQTVLHLGWLVAAGYLVIYALFFILTGNFYWKSLRVEADLVRA